MPYIGNPIYQSAFVTDQFSGNGSTTAFTMSVAPAGVSNVLVAVSGVLQDPSTYGVVGTTITFSTAPPSGTGNISCRYLGVPASGVTTTAYRTVTEFTATAGQTTFTPPSYTVGFISVFLNGVLLGSADYTASNGTTVVLATGASAGNILTVESLLVSSVLNAIPNTAGAVSSANIQTSPTLTTPTIDKINTSVTNTSLGAGNASIMKNRIINGAMVISQRGTASVTVNSTTQTFSTDRWWASGQATDGVFTMQQSSTAPVGFSNSLLTTITTADASIGVSQRYYIAQRIEAFNTADLGWGTADAKTVTLSFWVRSSVTGTFGGFIYNGAGDYTYPFTYTISAANTWEYETITIAGPTAGTWLGATNGTGMQIGWSLGAGSTASGTAGSWASAQYFGATGQTNIIATNGATFYFTGVQIEVGSSSTGFEYVNYQTSLANCQRYYYQTSSAATNNAFAQGWAATTTIMYGITTFPVTMRTAPTALSTSGTATDYGILVANTNTTCSAVPAFNVGSANSCLMNFTVASGLTAGQGGLAKNLTTNGYLGWSAEL